MTVRKRKGTALSSITRRARLEKGYPVNRGGKVSVTDKPPATSRGSAAKSKRSAAGKADSATIQDRLRTERKSGVRRGRGRTKK